MYIWYNYRAIKGLFIKEQTKEDKRCQPYEWM